MHSGSCLLRKTKGDLRHLSHVFRIFSRIRINVYELTRSASARVVLVQVVLQRVPATAHSDHHVIAKNLKKEISSQFHSSLHEKKNREMLKNGARPEDRYASKLWVGGGKDVSQWKFEGANDMRWPFTDFRINIWTKDYSRFCFTVHFITLDTWSKFTSHYVCIFLCYKRMFISWSDV